MVSEQVRQSGSVVSFLIVGIVLVGLVTGGLYMLHRQGTDRSMPNGPVATTSNKPASSPSQQAETSPSKSPAPSKSTKPESSKSPTVPTAPRTPLPETGPADNMLSGIAFAILLGVSIAYIQSRRASAEILYR